MLATHGHRRPRRSPIQAGESVTRPMMGNQPASRRRRAPRVCLTSTSGRNSRSVSPARPLAGPGEASILPRASSGRSLLGVSLRGGSRHRTSPRGPAPHGITAARKLLAWRLGVRATRHRPSKRSRCRWRRCPRTAWIGSMPLGLIRRCMTSSAQGRLAPTLRAPRALRYPKFPRGPGACSSLGDRLRVGLVRICLVRVWQVLASRHRSAAVATAASGTVSRVG